MTKLGILQRIVLNHNALKAADLDFIHALNIVHPVISNQPPLCLI
ncbi:hypothetical protein [Pseudanabaena sp. 'Roaring Creek']|nr:hypothetical protein [Pseudanabaena sp. 'Roaring Creek']